MASSVVIPQEIIDSIIEEVGDDTCLLKTCSLVSSKFLYPSRKRLFSSISLILEHDHRKWQRFHQLLVENPVLQSFVKTLDITLHRSVDSSSIVSILRLSFCSLECFTFSIEMWPHPTWNDLSSGLKDALLTIIHTSTLKEIHFDNVDVPIRLFQGIKLTQLKLRSGPLLFDINDRHSSLLTLPASEEVGKTASHTVIDQFIWEIDTELYGLPDPMFFPFTCHLRVLNIYVGTHSPVISGFDILTFLVRLLQICSSSATLEHLKLDVSFPSDDYHEYLALFDGLHYWNDLNSIVAHPAGSRLQSVDIDMEFYFHDDGDILNSFQSQVEDFILNSLPLLRKKGILSVQVHNMSSLASFQ